MNLIYISFIISFLIYKSSGNVYCILAKFFSFRKYDKLDSKIFTHTGGKPSFIHLWNMINKRYSMIYYTGIIENDYSYRVILRGTLMFSKGICNNNRITTRNIDVFHLMENLLKRIDRNWKRKVETMPLYHFPRIIDFYRYNYLVKSEIFRDYEFLIFIYTLTICKAISISKDYGQLCPRICQIRKGDTVDICGKTKHGIPGTCSLVGIGFLQKQYECQCELKYEWDYEKNLCVKEKSRTCTYSDQRDYCEGRYSCWDWSYTITPTCGCYSYFNTKRCPKKKFYPCSVTPKDGPTGNVACRTLLGGICNASSRDYFCGACPQGTKEDSSLNYPNCLRTAIDDPCKRNKDLCVNGGKCIPVKIVINGILQKINFKCECLKERYTGQFCEFPLSIWSDWTSWSSCYPSCGPFRNRYKFRTCLSNAAHTPCPGGIVQENEPCPNVNCTIPKSFDLINSDNQESDWIKSESTTSKSSKSTAMVLLSYSWSFLLLEALAILILSAICICGVWLMAHIRKPKNKQTTIGDNQLELSEEDLDEMIP